MIRQGAVGTNGKGKLRSGIGRRFFACEDRQALAQGAQISCGGPWIPGSMPGQAGRDWEVSVPWQGWHCGVPKVPRTRTFPAHPSPAILSSAHARGHRILRERSAQAPWGAGPGSVPGYTTAACPARSAGSGG